MGPCPLHCRALAASLISTIRYKQPPPRCGNQKCIQTLPNMPVGWELGFSPVKNYCSKVIIIILRNVIFLQNYWKLCISNNVYRGVKGFHSSFCCLNLLLYFYSVGHIIGAPKCLQTVLKNAWETHTYQSLNAFLFVCLLLFLLRLEHCESPIWPIRPHMIPALSV